MKKLILSMAVIALGAFTIQAQDVKKASEAPKPTAAPAAPAAQAVPTAPVNPNGPQIVFSTEVMDYGTIDHYADGNREFKFKNTGKEPLLITNCQGSCGCTVPTWPKEPIKPGASNVIKVHYATDRVGAFEKTVTVTSNAITPSKVIKIKGVVKAEPATLPASETDQANPSKQVPAAEPKH